MRALDPEVIFKDRLSTAARKGVGDLAGALFSAAAAALSGALLFAAFPPYNLSLFIWFAIAPLLWAVAGKTPGRSFLLGYLAGVVFFLGVFDYHWVFVVHIADPWLQAILMAYYGVLVGYSALYIGAFALCFGLVSRRFRLSVALAAVPFFWVAQEYLRANMFFLAFPWAFLAHSQYRVIPLIQVSSLTGAYGLSFLIALVNAAFFTLLLPVFRTGKKDSFQFTMTPAARWGLVFVASAALGATLVYGYVSMTNRWAGKSIKVAVLQGNIDKHRKFDRKFSRFIMDTYDRLTREAAQSAPDLIVWPESATPRYIESNPDIFLHVKRLAWQVHASLLIGTAGYPKFQTGDAAAPAGRNSVVLIRPDTGFGRAQKYDKVRLLPFGEYLPLKKVIPWSYIGVPAPYPTLPGRQARVISTPDFRVGTPICWEAVFPDLVRSFVRAGAQFLVNATNEGWFGKTAVPYYFLSMSVFRAVENRRFVVRCANTGISCIIDPCGRVVDRVRDKLGRDIFVAGTVSARITCLDSLSIYTRYGDWPAGASLIVSAGLLLACLRRSRLRGSPYGGPS